AASGDRPPETAARMGSAPLVRPAPPLVRRAAGEGLVVSFSQERIWSLERLTRGSAAYNLPNALRLAGRLDVGALVRGLHEIVRRHEVLRSFYPAVAGKPVMAVAPRLLVAVPVVDLSHLGRPADGAVTEAERAAAATGAATTAAEAAGRCIGRELGMRLFDLESGPLLRAALLRPAPRQHQLVLVLHHIVADGWSLQVMLRELIALYEAFAGGAPDARAAAGSGLPGAMPGGLPGGLPELPVQYSDFARWERAWLAGGGLAAHLDYWRRALTGAPARLELPADRPPPAVRSFAGGRVSALLPPAAAAGLRRAGRQGGATLFMLLLAAFDVLLHRATGQSDVVVGSPVANRERLELEGLIGPVTNVVALRVDLDGRPTFRELLERVRQVSLAAYAHQGLPFDLVLAALAPRRGRAAALFQVQLLALEAWPGASAAGVAMRLDPVGDAIAKLDLTAVAVQSSAGLAVSFEYSRARFDAATVKRLLAQYLTLLEAAAAALGSPLAARAIDALPWLTAAERQQLLEWRAAAPGGQCLHILDRHGQEAPIGVAGEVHVELTPAGNGAAGRPRLRATGDRARRLPDGTIEWLGRAAESAAAEGVAAEADLPAPGGGTSQSGVSFSR
ncbi:MAG TPA: condensation domain-containing protein, partial [Thermoanaerobaculia bacterium]|nr:condensation domain-containing protein [Thermoanaerobaculia bacterium]